MIVAAGTVVLALTVTGARTASTLDLAPGLFLIGLGAGSSIGQLFDFILAGVGMNEVGSASGVLEAVQQLSSALGVAVSGTIFFTALGGHLPNARLGHYGVGVPGTTGRHIRAPVQAPDARPRATTVTETGAGSADVDGIEVATLSHVLTRHSRLRGIAVWSVT